MASPVHDTVCQEFFPGPVAQDLKLGHTNQGEGQGWD